MARYTKVGRRSRRKAPKELRGRILSRDEATVQLSLPIVEILAEVEGSVEALAAEAGLLMIRTLIEDEVEFKAGEKHERWKGRTATRWGNEDGYVVFAGRKVPIERPRLRGADGREVPIERYRLFQSDGRMQRAVARNVLARVSTRKCEDVIDTVCDGYGAQKSSVSRHWKAVSAAELQKLMARPPGNLDLAVLMVDGIQFQEFLVVLALGITKTGKKQVLGIWQGATENGEVCKTLLEDLVDRGLRTDQQYLFVLDGSKALRKGVRSCFGDGALVQRCQIHKERNILSHLSETYHAVVRRRLRAAWATLDYDRAQSALLKLAAYLEEINPAAAASLHERLEETLTLQKLGLPGGLWRSLRSTNPIESCLSRMSDLCRNVRRWRNANMAWRWAGTMLLEAEKRFRRIVGHRERPILVAALEKSVAVKKQSA